MERLWKIKVYFDVLHYIIDKYNDTYHKTNNTKAIDVKSSFYVDLCWLYVNFNNNNPDF